jgi:hypothetical protein
MARGVPSFVFRVRLAVQAPTRIGLACDVQRYASRLFEARAWNVQVTHITVPPFGRAAGQPGSFTGLGPAWAR